MGTISSLEHALESLDDRLQERESDLKQYHRQKDDLARQLDQPFEHEEKLAAAVTPQQEIISALDITKNQASATVDEGAEKNSETVQEETQKASRKRNGVAASVGM